MAPFASGHERARLRAASRLGVLRRILAFTLVAIAGTARAADGAGPSVVAVFEVRDPSHVLSQADRKSLTRYLATKLAETGRFQVVPESDVRRVLEDKKLESYDACYDEACQIEIGKELAAQKSVAVEIVQLGESCAMTALVYDLAKAASERAATEKGSCAIEALVVSIERLAVRLSSERTTPVETKQAPPPPGTLRKSTKALSAMRFQFETRTERTFNVELIGSDGFRHTCDPPVKSGAFCTVEQVAIGEARLRVTSDGLLDHDRDFDIEPKNFVELVQLDTMASEGSVITWSFGGIALAVGAALIPVGIGTDESGFIYGGVPSLLVGGALLVAGFLFDERVAVREVVFDD